MEPFDIYILDDNFRTVALVDNYESMIWTDRYRECGDFELYLSAETSLMSYFIPGYYIWQKESDRMMVIENIEITTDVEDGNHLKITGRSLESILDRRIIWNKVTLSGTVQSVVKTLITDAIINPGMSERKISNFIFVDNDDSRLAECTVEETQFLGENLYDTIIDILSVNDIGLKLIYNFDTNNFEFSIFMGADYSYKQTLNPYVVFSPEFDNIISSDYIESIANYKNVNLICGEEPDKDSGKSRKFVYTNDGSEITGINRREMFTDGSSNQQEYTDENDNKVVLTDSQYISILREASLQSLYAKDNRITKSMDGELLANRLVYMQDYYIGDLVQYVNEYGFSSSARIIEMIISQSANEISHYPTFESVKEE